MDDDRYIGLHRPLERPPRIGDDPNGGQVIGPDGESPEDPAARWLFRSCLITLLVIGIVLGIAVLIYRSFAVA